MVEDNRKACLKCIESYQLPEEILGKTGNLCFWCLTKISRFNNESEKSNKAKGCGKVTLFTKKQLEEEILFRMGAGLDTSNENLSNNDLVKDFKELLDNHMVNIAEEEK